MLEERLNEVEKRNLRVVQEKESLQSSLSEKLMLHSIKVRKIQSRSSRQQRHRLSQLTQKTLEVELHLHRQQKKKTLNNEIRKEINSLRLASRQTEKIRKEKAQ